jgi:hypothetical protein
MSEKRTGPHVIQGKLFFKMPDGSSISCECIGEPYASQIVEMWEDQFNDGYSCGGYHAAPAGYQ